MAIKTKTSPADITEHSTTEQLRADMDRGLTGDKVRHADAAAAPLGTDEEAAGTPVDGRTVSAARRADRRGSGHPRPTPRLGAAWFLLGFVLLCAGAIAAWKLLA